MNKSHFAIIMAGGVGSRFWPMSKKNYPKQFIDILNKNKSLFQITFERFTQICPKENIYVVANDAYVPLIKAQVPDIHLQNILQEPEAKNTACCLAYATYKIKQQHPDAVFVVSPSDHYIPSLSAFKSNIHKALSIAAQEDILITLGIQPNRPDTGYGYIHMDESEEIEGICKVKDFTEKPNYALAQSFLESGDYLWNSGIFVWNAKSIDRAFKRFLPKIRNLFASKQAFFTEKEKNHIQNAYQKSETTSIDYGIMEKADNVYVLSANFQWSDIGTWNALFDYLPKDEQNNAVNVKNGMITNAKNCLINVYSEQLVAINGLNNVIVVEANGVLLITDRNREQEVKQMVQRAKKDFGEDYI